MPRYYLHTTNSQQALEAINKALPSVRLSVDLNISEQELPIINQQLVLDVDNKLSVNMLKKIAKKNTTNLPLC